jgi:hypothetical protein
MGCTTGQSKSYMGFLFLFTQDAHHQKITQRYTIAFEQEHFCEGSFLSLYTLQSYSDLRQLAFRGT